MNIVEPLTPQLYLWINLRKPPSNGILHHSMTVIDAFTSQTINEKNTHAHQVPIYGRIKNDKVLISCVITFISIQKKIRKREKEKGMKK